MFVQSKHREEQGSRSSGMTLCSVLSKGKEKITTTECLSIKIYEKHLTLSTAAWCMPVLVPASAGSDKNEVRVTTSVASHFRVVLINKKIY